jgi:hypothetical protein
MLPFLSKTLTKLLLPYTSILNPTFLGISTNKITTGFDKP